MYFDYLENLPANRYILKDVIICSKENNSNVSWHKYVQTLMEKNEINFQNYPRTQGCKLIKSERKKIKTCFKQKYLDFFKTKLKKSEKLLYYKQIDRKYNIATYLKTITNSNFRQALTKLRNSAHKLKTETGRFNKTLREYVNFA